MSCAGLEQVITNVYMKVVFVIKQGQVNVMNNGVGDTFV